MRVRRWSILTFAAAICALSAEQSQIDLLARARFAPEFGAGLTGLKLVPAALERGRYAVLTARGPLVFLSSEGQRVGQIPAADAPASSPGLPASGFLHADDFDFSADGRVYIADRGANKVYVFSPAGALERAVEAPAPNSVVALEEGEIAVSSTAPGTPREPLPRVINVYDARGRLVRQFGTPVELAQRAEVNRLINLGRLVPATKGELYYFYSYLPEPTVRRYNRFGFSQEELVVASLEFAPAAQATRREIAAQDRRRGFPSLKPVLIGLGVDAESGDLWLAVGPVLLHYSSTGERRGGYRPFTPEGVRVEATLIVVEPDRLLLGADPLGLYTFPRPDKLRR
jgi:hypothetical protein